MGEIIAKFRCNDTQDTESGTKVGLAAIQPSERDSKVTREENEKFWRATPNGTLNMQIDNPKATDYFKQGKSYYLHFEEADE